MGNEQVLVEWNGMGGGKQKKVITNPFRNLATASW